MLGNESLALISRCVCVCACIRSVSWWMLPLSWSVFLSGQQIDPPPHRSQLLLLCLSSFNHKSLLLASSVTWSHFPNPLLFLTISTFVYLSLPLYSLPHILLWLSSILIPLFLSSYLCLTLSFSHFLSISAHLSFLSAAQSQRVDDLAGKTPSPTLRKSIMWLNAS